MADQSLGTTTIVQIGLIVRDVEATAHGWADTFGLPMPEIITSDPVDKAHTEYRGRSSTARARQAFFQMGPVQLELIEPIGEPSTWRDQLEQHGESIHHIAFRVAGIQDKLAYLATKGMPLIQRGDFTGGRYAYCDSAAKLGLILELLEND
jgi:catechol 2,3-dioxygenase-like lactoylglutathione lyase family enzyme